MAFPQTISGKWGWENVTSTTKYHKLGTIMQIADSRYVYAKAGEAVSVGQLMEASGVEASENDDLAVTTGASAGGTSVIVTFGGAVTANEYADGTLFFNSATASGGYSYRVKSHLAGTANVTINIDHEDGFAETVTAGTDTAGFYKSPYDSVLQSNTTAVGPVVGVTRNDIASGSYGWLQVEGQSVALIQGTPGAGLGIMRSNGTAGAVELNDGSLSLVGQMGRTAGVDAEYHEVFLNIR